MSDAILGIAMFICLILTWACWEIAGEVLQGSRRHNLGVVGNRIGGSVFCLLALAAFYLIIRS